MSEESTTHDLEELTRRSLDALNCSDYDSHVAVYARDAVLDLSALGSEVLEGRKAIREFLEGWRGPYANFELELQEFRDLGNGVTFALAHSWPSAAGESLLPACGELARAEAGILGFVPSPNLSLAQQIFASWRRGDFSSAGWAHQEIELIAADGPSPGTWTGRDGIAAGMRDLLSAWEELHIEGHEFRELDDYRVLVLARFSGRGKTSGLDLDDMRSVGAGVFEFRDGKVTRYTYWLDAQRALSELGFTETGSVDWQPRSRLDGRGTRGG